jgi:hypothetical protein
MNDILTELINISIGELWDKYTILLIKKQKVKNIDKVKFVSLELELLDNNMKKYNYQDNKLFLDLKNVNEELWEIEDAIRIKELNKEFDNKFIELARSIYVKNDKRANFKNKINDFFGSSIKEIKDYTKYD